MRVWGRTYDEYGVATWVAVTTQANGLNDYVNLTWLVQVCKLNTGEDPFYANWGVPARQSILMQVAPDFAMNRIQQRFAPLFASLKMSRTVGTDQRGAPCPAYSINVLTHQGVSVELVVPT